MKTITVTGFGGVTSQIEVEDNDPRVTVVTTKGEDK